MLSKQLSFYGVFFKVLFFPTKQLDEIKLKLTNSSMLLNIIWSGFFVVGSGFGCVWVFGVFLLLLVVFCFMFFVVGLVWFFLFKFTEKHIFIQFY